MSSAYLTEYSLPLGIAIALGIVALMEVTAYATHRWVMHGPLGWGWHESHHQERHGAFEKNDLYAVVFAGLAITLFAIAAFAQIGWLFYIAVGIPLYGILYFIAHDGLVHQRWPFRIVPKGGYMQRLYQAHRLHHAVDGREGCVSFGFLYAPPIRVLKDQLRSNAVVTNRSARANKEA